MLGACVAREPQGGASGRMRAARRWINQPDEGAAGPRPPQRRQALAGPTVGGGVEGLGIGQRRAALHHAKRVASVIYQRK